jgi:uncharacterized repeat protein (TIGR01451 family)
VTPPATVVDPDLSNNTATDVDEQALATDLQLLLTDSPDPLTQGAPLTYTFTVSNLGPEPAWDVTVTQELDANVAAFVSASPGCSHAAGTVTCAIGAVAAFGSAAVTVIVTPTAPGDLFASGTVTATGPDPDTSNNTAYASTTVNPIPALFVDSPQMQEGNVDGTLVFTVTLSVASSQVVTVDYATANGSATAGSDYQTASGTLTFDPGVTSLPIPVTVLGDTDFEPHETLIVNLSNPVNAAISDGQGDGTILNDDAQAGPSRVFVSVLGLDTNDCSDVLTPCRTLGGAITQVATDGEVIVTRSGSYAGAVIAKAVKINVAQGVVAFSGQPLSVDPGPGWRVVIQGMTVKAATPGTGTGIAHQSGDLFLERTIVDGWQVGLSSTSTGKLFVTDSTFRNNVGAGVLLTSGEAAFESSRLLANFWGLRLLSGKATVSDSMISGNAVGLLADGASDVNLEKTQLGSNQGAAVLVPETSPSIVRPNRCVVTGNGAGVQNEGGTIVVTGTNVVRGNGEDVLGTITTSALR